MDVNICHNYYFKNTIIYYIEAYIILGRSSGGGSIFGKFGKYHGVPIF